MSQFTPGPWTWNERPHECSTYHELTGSDGEKVIESAEYEGCWLSNHKHTEANAALIAAAPELYAALVRLLRTTEEGGFWDTDAAAAAARAVLAKVTP